MDIATHYGLLIQCDLFMFGPAWPVGRSSSAQYGLLVQYDLFKFGPVWPVGPV